jgi:hypothetical protein
MIKGVLEGGEKVRLKEEKGVLEGGEKEVEEIIKYAV